MACISVGSIFDTSTKQQLVREILSPNGDWESFLKNAVSEKTDVLIEKINKVIQAYGGREELIRLDEDFSLDVNAFRDAIFYEIESNGANMRRSETQLVEKPDINIAFEPWDAGGKSRLTKAFNHKLTSSIIINTKVVNGRNPIVAHEFLGSSVEGKDMIIIDDMISSGESMIDTARELKKRKANRIFVVSTFGLFTNGLASFDKAYEEGLIYRVVTTNLIYQTPELLSREYYISCDMSKYIAYIIDTLNHDSSISDLLNPYDRIKNYVKKYNDAKNA